jgi:hypothetical protein
MANFVFRRKMKIRAQLRGFPVVFTRSYWSSCLQAGPSEVKAFFAFLWPSKNTQKECLPFRPLPLNLSNCFSDAAFAAGANKPWLRAATTR